MKRKVGKFLQFIQIIITPLLTNFHFLKNKLEAHKSIGIDDDYNMIVIKMTVAKIINNINITTKD